MVGVLWSNIILNSDLWESTVQGKIEEENEDDLDTSSEKQNNTI